MKLRQKYSDCLNFISVVFMFFVHFCLFCRLNIYFVFILLIIILRVMSAIVEHVRSEHPNFSSLYLTKCHMRSVPTNSAPVFLSKLWFKLPLKVILISLKFWRRLWGYRSYITLMGVTLSARLSQYASETREGNWGVQIYILYT